MSPLALVANPAQILIICEDPACRSALLELIGDEGYQVQAATLASEAAQLLARQRFDAVVVDFSRCRAELRELLEVISARPGPPSIIVLDVYEGSSQFTGHALHLVKPVQAHALLAALDHNLAPAQQAVAVARAL